MVTYAKEELIGVTEFGKSIGAYLDKVIASPLNKLALVRRNKPEAVIIPIEEYERMQEISEYLELKDIYDTIQERVENRKTPAKYTSQEDMMKLINKKLDNV